MTSELERLSQQLDALADRVLAYLHAQGVR